MRASFVQRGVAPPCGWVYSTEHDGEVFTFQAGMRTGLMQDLKNWYRNKDLDWPGDKEMEARVEEYICSKVPKGFCKGDKDREHNPVFSVSNIRAATQLFTSKMFKGEDFFVDQDEANRRALTCANCPKNLRGFCVSCASSNVQDILASFVRSGKKTPYDNVLDVCGVCGCIARAKVWVSMEVLGNLPKHKYPENCWLHGTPAHKPMETES